MGRGFVLHTPDFRSVVTTLDVRDDLAFVIADSTYPDLKTVIGHQAQQMFGGWIRAFIPVALTMAEWRGDFSIADVSPKTSVILPVAAWTMLTAMSLVWI